MASQESGIKGLTLEFVREATRGVNPVNPAYLLYSDAVQNFSLSPTASINPRGNIGSADIVNFNSGTESHSFSVQYDLQRWFTASTDAAYDGLARLASGALPSSHMVVGKATHGGDGAAGAGGFIYYVMNGALINTVGLAGEPESGDPIVVDLSYMCEKQRAYMVDTPASTTQLTVVSSDIADTTQSITIEDNDAAISETLALTGTTPVLTVSVLYGEIEGALLDAECVGDVTITDGSNLLMTIYGSDSYGGREGDLGIPLLGASGTHASAVGAVYETILGDTIERPAATSLAFDGCISSASISVDNAIEANSCISQIGQKLSEGPRTVTLDASLFGPKISFDMMREHLQATETNIVWTMTGGTLTLVGAALTSLGSVSRDTGQAVLTLDNTFQGKSLTIA